MPCLAMTRGNRALTHNKRRPLMTLTLDRPVAPLVTDDATRREFIVGGLVTALVLAGCGDDNGRSGEGGAIEPMTRTVTDAFGEVEIPLGPQRVAALFPNACGDDVLELGGPLVALAGFAGTGDVPPSIDPEELGGVELLGSGTELNLEALAATEPDLIIGMAFNTETILDELAAVAPTYTFPEEHLADRSVTERLRAVADLLGANYHARAEEVAGAYEQRIRTLRQRLAPVLEGKTVGVVALYLDEGTAFVMGEDTYAGGILADLGATRPPEQQEGFVELSLEEIERADADILFYLTSPGEDATEFVATGPMSTLGAVRAGSAYQVLHEGFYWENGSIRHARLILDDVERHLLA